MEAEIYLQLHREVEVSLPWEVSREPNQREGEISLLIIVPPFSNLSRAINSGSSVSEFYGIISDIAMSSRRLFLSYALSLF